jgi:hypothetical protein
VHSATIALRSERTSSLSVPSHTKCISPANSGPKLREAKQVTWPISQFTMSLVGFEHVFTGAQPVEFSPDLTLRVISSTALMLLKLVAFMDDPRRRVKDLDDNPGLAHTV